MNSLADLVFSPANNKLEEPCESWWVDWYPSGHATPESLLHSKAKHELPIMDAAPQDAYNRKQKDFWAADDLDCCKPEQNQAEAVPCIAQDLELEIAELEQQAWSDSGLSDLGVFCDDDISFADDGATSFAPTCILRPSVDAFQSWGVMSRKLPSLAVDVQRRCKAEEALDSAKESSHGSAGDGDTTPSSGDDASTHSSFARSSPKASSTSAPTAIPTSSLSLPSSLPAPAAPAPRVKPTTVRPLSRPVPASSGQHSSSSVGATANPSELDPTDVSSHHRHPTALPPPIPQQQQQHLPQRPLKRTSSSASTSDATALSPPAKVARIERPRREGSGVNTLILARCGADITPASPAKSATDGHRGKRSTDAARSPVAKGKGKGKGRAAGGSPRGGKKRVPAKCAPPAPGVHACSQCGAQSTPVWRAGPFGPKTLCNACGVRYMKIAKRK